MMFVEMLSQFGKKKDDGTTFDPSIEIFAVTIPARSAFLGVMEAFICPHCTSNKICMFGSLDNDSLTIKCDDCGLEVSHSDRTVIEKIWRSLKETTCPNCNTLFNLLIEKGLA